MRRYSVKFRLIEITDREITIDADSLEEAVEVVEDMQFDVSDSRQFDCHRFEIEILVG